MQDLIDGNPHDIVSAIVALTYLVGRRLWLRSTLGSQVVEDFSLGFSLHPYALMAVAILSSAAINELMAHSRIVITMAGIAALVMSFRAAKQRLSTSSGGGQPP